MTLFPSLSLGWQDILLSHTVLNEEPVRLPFSWTGIALRLFYAALSVTPKQTNKHTLAAGFWRNLHRSEQGCFATRHGAGEGTAEALMPRFSQLNDFSLTPISYEWHKFSSMLLFSNANSFQKEPGEGRSRQSCLNHPMISLQWNIIKMSSWN